MVGMSAEDLKAMAADQADQAADQADQAAGQGGQVQADRAPAVDVEMRQPHPMIAQALCLAIDPVAGIICHKAKVAPLVTEEVESLANAGALVMAQYDVETNPKALAWLTLLAAITSVGHERWQAYRERVRREGRASERRQAAQETAQGGQDGGGSAFGDGAPDQPVQAAQDGDPGAPGGQASVDPAPKATRKPATRAKKAEN
jgi:hypothetical protein